MSGWWCTARRKEGKHKMTASGTTVKILDCGAMSIGPPTTPGSLINDLAAWYLSVEKIRKLAEETNATLVFGSRLRTDEEATGRPRDLRLIKRQ